MIDSVWEELLSKYLKLCDVHRRAVDQLVTEARDRRHRDFKVTVVTTRKLAVEMETAYAALVERRKSPVKRDAALTKP